MPLNQSGRIFDGARLFESNVSENSEDSDEDQIDPREMRRLLHEQMQKEASSQILKKIKKINLSQNLKKLRQSLLELDE